MAAITSRLTGLRSRRIFAVAITLAASCAAWMLLEQVRRLLGDQAMASGWMLLASTLCLYGLGWRKRAHAARLGSVATWLQVHTYLGWFALIAFAWHVGWPVTGRFESALAAMFLFISGSGIVLIIASRRVPRQLAVVRRDYRLEDIPQIQANLATEAHRVALDSAATISGATLTEYYQRRLLKFFHAPRSIFYRVWPTGNTRRQLLRDLDDLDRYLDADGIRFRKYFSQLVVAKDDTDFHRALQLRLRFLMTAHLALTWSLLLMIVLHVVLVLRFQGAMV